MGLKTGLGLAHVLVAVALLTSGLSPTSAQEDEKVPGPPKNDKAVPWGTVGTYTYSLTASDDFQMFYNINGGTISGWAEAKSTAWLCLGFSSKDEGYNGGDYLIYPTFKGATDIYGHPAGGPDADLNPPTPETSTATLASNNGDSITIQFSRPLAAAETAPSDKGVTPGTPMALYFASGNTVNAKHDKQNQNPYIYLDDPNATFPNGRPGQDDAGSGDTIKFLGLFDVPKEIGTVFYVVAVLIAMGIIGGGIYAVRRYEARRHERIVQQNAALVNAGIIAPEILGDVDTGGIPVGGGGGGGGRLPFDDGSDRHHRSKSSKKSKHSHSSSKKSKHSHSSSKKSKHSRSRSRSRSRDKDSSRELKHRNGSGGSSAKHRHKDKHGRHGSSSSKGSSRGGGSRLKHREGGSSKGRSASRKGSSKKGGSSKYSDDSDRGDEIPFVGDMDVNFNSIPSPPRTEAGREAEKNGTFVFY